MGRANLRTGPPMSSRDWLACGPSLLFGVVLWVGLLLLSLWFPIGTIIAVVIVVVLLIKGNY